MAKRKGKWEVWRVDALMQRHRHRFGPWYFRLRAPNGKIICQSEGYKTRAGALNGIRSIQANADSEVVEVSGGGE